MKKEDTKFIKKYESNRNNAYTSFFQTKDEKINLIFHSDNLSPFKRRMIQIIGQGLFIEGDYIKQTIQHNGKTVKVNKGEPLEIELKHFLDRKYTRQELSDAIENRRIFN